MSQKTRTDLKGLFANGKKLNQLQFHDLIDSMLNKRDDCFMGKWRSGVAYRTGQVVIHNHALWEVTADASGKCQEICSCEPPNPEDVNWESLIVPVEDDDWEADPDTGSMFAKVYKCVGIGRMFNNVSDPPDARLEVVKEELLNDVATVRDRFLIFPKEATTPQISLLQVGDSLGRQNSYFIIGLDEQQGAALTTDAPAGFIFRRNDPLGGDLSGKGEPDDPAHPNINEHHVLMVVQPGMAGTNLAKVGISTPDPCAMLDITDGNKGQFLFNPETSEDPLFTIINLDPETDPNYLTTTVGAEWATFMSDAPKGYVFKKGAAISDPCTPASIADGTPLMVIQCPEGGSPTVGVGTDEPCGMLHVTDGQKGAFIVNPNGLEDPMIKIVNLDPANQQNYLAAGVGTERAAFVTDAPNGFAFKAGEEATDICNSPDVNAGEKLVIMLPDGKVGIGTKSYDPTVRLEVTDEDSGNFLFNLNNHKVNPALAIVNTRPSKDNYFTIGADNQTAILVTDSKNGFVFKQGAPMQDTNNTNHYEVDVNQGDALFKLAPPAINAPAAEPAHATFFPLPNQRTGKVGIMRKAESYQLDLQGMMRTYDVFFDTDEASLSDEQDLATYLKDKYNNQTALALMLQLKPTAFTWDLSTGYHTDPVTEPKQIGLKAQEVQDIIKEVVREKPNERLSVSYTSLIPMLIEAIKEQQEQINQLKARLQAAGIP